MATKPKRGLLEQSIPLPAGQGYPQSPGPDAGYGGTLNSLSYGIGTGMRNQLAGLLDMAKNPVQYGNALLQAALHPSQSLPAIGNALADQYRMATSGASGFGQVLGENISPRGLLGVTAAAAGKPIMREAVAYHGSPHNFDEFSLSKIGTGEGNHSFGYGLYLTDSKDVARPYTRFLDKTGKEIPSTTGHVYTTDIPDDAVAKMVNLDLPLSQQPEAVQQIAKTLDVSKLNGRLKRQIQAWRGEKLDASPGAVIPEPTAGELLDAATDYGKNAQANAAFSEKLKAAGIPGLVYRDRSQVGRAKGARNFVVFDDKLIKVLKKD